MNNCNPRFGRAVRFGRQYFSYLLVWPLVTACERSSYNVPTKSHALQDALIVMIGPSDGHPQWPGIRGGAERFFASVPSLRSYCIAPREETAESLRTTVERVLEWQPKVVCLCVASSEAARPSIDLIASRQVLLITIGEPTADPRVTAHVGVDLPAAAELLGENLTLVAAGRRSYLLLHEEGRSTVATNCYYRFSEAAQRQYEVTLLEAAKATPEDTTPAQLVERVLRLFPHAGLIVTLNPDVWLTAQPGWHQQLHELNADFRFAALSAAPVLWPRLGTPEKPGDAAALAGPLDGELGYAATQLATHLLISTERPPSRITIPCELVTAENLADFSRRYAEAANGLDVSAYLPPGTSRPASRPTGEQ